MAAKKKEKTYPYWLLVFSDTRNPLIKKPGFIEHYEGPFVDELEAEMAFYRLSNENIAEGYSYMIVKAIYVAEPPSVRAVLKKV